MEGDLDLFLGDVMSSGDGGSDEGCSGWSNSSVTFDKSSRLLSRVVKTGFLSFPRSFFVVLVAGWVRNVEVSLLGNPIVSRALSFFSLSSSFSVWEGALDLLDDPEIQALLPRDANVESVSLVSEDMLEGAFCNVEPGSGEKFLIELKIALDEGSFRECAFSEALFGTFPTEDESERSLVLLSSFRVLSEAKGTPGVVLRGEASLR